MLGRPQIAHRRRGPEAAPSRILQIARTLVVAVIIVVVVTEPRLLAGIDIGVGQFVEMLQAGHADRAVAAAQGRIAALVTLHALEIGQHLRPAPARQAHVLPGIEFARIAAHIDIAVDRAGTAQHPAARPQLGAVLQGRLRLGDKGPGVVRILQQVHDHQGNMDVEAAVAPARLDQQHPVRPVFRQAVGDGAAGRAGAHDDKIVFMASSRHASFPHLASSGPTATVCGLSA